MKITLLTLEARVEFWDGTDGDAIDASSQGTIRYVRIAQYPGGGSRLAVLMRR